MTMEQKVEMMYKELSEKHPEYQEELNVLKQAYDNPFEHFCEQEAEYRLNDVFNIDKSVKDYEQIKGLVAYDLMDADNYPDPEVADEIIKDVLEEYAFVITKTTAEDIENTSLINIEKSDPDVLTRRIMKDTELNTLDAYDSIFESLMSGKFKDFDIYKNLLEEIRAKFGKNQDELNDWYEVKDLSHYLYTEKLWIRHLKDCKYQVLCVIHELVHDYKVIAKLIENDTVLNVGNLHEESVAKKILNSDERSFHIATFHKPDGAIRKSKEFMEIL